MPCRRACNAPYVDVKEKSKRNGLRHSVFSTHWYPKDRYKGEWKNDAKEGKGVEITRNGYVYEGTWKHGERQGFGTLSKIPTECQSSRRIVHLGCWCGGKKHGYALHWYADSFYKGQYELGKKCGYGQMWWHDGQYYEGYWRDDKFHGKGTLYLTNCNVYEGQFREGKKHGYGVYYHKSTGQIQRGYWTEDSCVSSWMEDAEYRQSARRPTPYPITRIPDTPDYLVIDKRSCKPAVEFSDYCKVACC